MTTIPPQSIKALCFESSAGPAGIGIYQVDEAGCPRKPIIHVEMTVTEMVETGLDLLRAARRIDAGEAYGARMMAPMELTPDDEKVILDLLRRPPPETPECCS